MVAIFGFLRRKAPKRTERQKTGQAGERVAERFLKKHGYRILARNVTYRQGEVDLVAQDKRAGTLCFVEVRSRTLAGGTEPDISPEATVTLAKRRRVISAARTFLTQRRATERPVPSTSSRSASRATRVGRRISATTRPPSTPQAG